MAEVQRRSEVGTDIRGFATSWPIRGIRVDNPSGSWLRVTAISGNDSYIPPYTLGWQRVLSPAVLNLDVLFTTSPSGSPSTLIGDPITVTISDLPLPNESGYATGVEGEQTPTSVRLQVFGGLYTATETPTLISPWLTLSSIYRIIPHALHVWGGVSGLQALHTQAVVDVINGLGQSVFPSAVVSAWNPATRIGTPVGIEIGNAVELSLMSVRGGGKQGLVVRMEYYAVLV